MLYHKLWKYHNTILVLLSFVFVFHLIRSNADHQLVAQLSEWGIVGVFLTGVFFVSSFTVAPAAVILYQMAQVMDPYQVTFFGGLGGIVGDYILFRILKDGLYKELKPLFNKLSRKAHLNNLIHTPFFGWITPLLGAAIIVSPLPDEAGITMLGISKLSTRQFLMIVLPLDFLSVWLIVSVATIK